MLNKENKKRLVEALDDDRIEEIVEEIFEDTVKFSPSYQLINSWLDYIRRKGWDKDEDTLYEKLGSAVDLMKGYYVDLRFYPHRATYNKSSFDPDGYELCLEAERKGLGDVDLGYNNIDYYALGELIDLVDSGWKPFEITWAFTGSVPSEYIEIYYSDPNDAFFGGEVRKFIDEVSDKYDVDEDDVEEILDDFAMDPNNFDELDKVVSKGFSSDSFGDMFIAYCKKSDWEEVKKQLEKYVVDELKELYDDLEEPEEVGESRIKKFRSSRRRKGRG